MPFFMLNRKLCRKDSICITLCPAVIIKPDEEGYPYIKESDAGRCIKCGQCASFCPYGACGVGSIAVTENTDLNLMPSREQTGMLLRSRRSVRMFRQEGLPKDKIDELLKLAGMAPSAANTRALRWVIVDGRDKMRQTGDLVITYFKNEASRLAEEMPQYADFMERLARAYDSGKDVIFRGAPQLITAVAPTDFTWKLEDGTAALTYLEIAAHGHGAGVCWAGYFTVAARVYEPLKEFLGIVDGEYVCGAQMAGWPLLGAAKKIPDKEPYRVDYI